MPGSPLTPRRRKSLPPTKRQNHLPFRTFDLDGIMDVEHFPRRLHRGASLFTAFYLTMLLVINGHQFLQGVFLPARTLAIVCNMVWIPLLMWIVSHAMSRWNPEEDKHGSYFRTKENLNAIITVAIFAVIQMVYTVGMSSMYPNSRIPRLGSAYWVAYSNASLALTVFGIFAASAAWVAHFSCFSKEYLYVKKVPASINVVNDQ
jgi:hypothetical protein